jgi:thioredoxin reductase (NADPH)
MSEPASTTLETRRAQAFPVLSAEEIERVARFGTRKRYAAGEHIYETGKRTEGLALVLSGVVRVTGRDGHGHDLPVVDHGPGSFSGEVGQLSGRRSFVDATALSDVEALLISPEQLRALVIAEATLARKPCALSFCGVSH